MKKSVLAVIFNSDKSAVLLTKRRDVPVWVLPGGGVDAGEQPEAAVIREAFEETALDVQITRKVGEYTPINRLSNYTYLFECQVLKGNPATGDETKEVGFFQINNLPIDFFMVHQRWLEDTLLNESQIIKKPIDNVTYFEVFKYFLRHPLHFLRYSLSWFGFPINSKD